MDHNGSGRLPAMAEPVESGLFDNQDRVGGAVAGGIEGGLKDERGGLSSRIAVAAGALPQEGGPTTAGLEGLGVLSTLDSGLRGCGEDTDLVLPNLSEALRKAVPSSGPPAPPTVAMSVVATSLRTPPGLAGIPPAR